MNTNFRFLLIQKMSFEDTYRGKFQIYSIFGMCPLRIWHSEFESPCRMATKSTNKYRRTILIAIEAVLLMCLLTFECLNLVKDIMLWNTILKNNTIGLLNEFNYINVLASRCLLIIITVESNLKYSKSMKILQNLYEIDRIFADKLNFRMNFHRMKNTIQNAFVACFFIFIIYISSSIAFYLSQKEFSTYSIVFLLYYSIKFILNASRYQTYTHLIRHRIEAMHEMLDAMLETHKNPQEQNYWIERSQMVHLRRIFNKIFDTVQLTNTSFGVVNFNKFFRECVSNLHNSFSRA